jgi:hypothetical protein
MTSQSITAMAIERLELVDAELTEIFPDLPREVQDLVLLNLVRVRLTLVDLRARVNRSAYEKARRNGSAAGFVTAQGGPRE